MKTLFNVDRNPASWSAYPDFSIWSIEVGYCKSLSEVLGVSYVSVMTSKSYNCISVSSRSSFGIRLCIFNWIILKL